MEVFSKISKDMYCPDKNSCDPPSSHEVCQFHEPGELAAICDGYIETTITEKQAMDMLDWVNGLRKQASLGQLKGKDGKVLPKAYGMIKLQWDSEIAALMQYKLTECEGSHPPHRCFATERSSTHTLIPHYRIIKLADPIAFYKERTHDAFAKITPDDINKSPDLKIFSVQSQRTLGLIQSDATHIGCASADYKTSSKMQTWIYCAVTTMVEPGTPVYNLTAPGKKGLGFSPTCGCKLHYRESDGCLCEEYRPKTTSTYATYRTFQTLSGLSLNEEQWNRGIFDRKLQKKLDEFGTTTKGSCNKPLFKCKPKILLLPVLNIKRTLTNSLEFEFKNVFQHRTITTTVTTKYEAPSTRIFEKYYSPEVIKAPQPKYNSFHNKQPLKPHINTITDFKDKYNTKNPFKIPQPDDVYNNQLFEPYINSLTDYKDKYNIKSPSEILTPQPDDMYNKQQFEPHINTMTDYNDKYNTKSPSKIPQPDDVYNNQLFEPYTNTLTDYKDKYNIKSPFEIIESMEAKTKDSLEKIVHSYHNKITRRNAGHSDTHVDNKHVERNTADESILTNLLNALEGRL